MLALVLAGGLACAGAAQAATYTAVANSDATGTCANPAAGTCSLRQLINYENGLGSATPNPVDTIDVPAGLLSLSNGELRIQQSVVIAGAGARQTTIDQLTVSPTSRVFGVYPNAQLGLVPAVTISGMTIEHGTADSTNGFYGGNVLNEAALTLDHDSVQLGQTTSGSGAGISNEGGRLTVTHSLVAGNGASTTNDSGGIQNFGPNPVTGTAGTLMIDNSTISNNNSAQGGGIMSWCGGACSSDGSGSVNHTTIVNSTIAFNDGGVRASGGGGLLASDGGTISVQNSIVAGNTVDTPASATASNCGTSGTTPGVITSAGHNLETASDCGFTASGDLQNTDPKLYSNPYTGTGPQNWGGDTDTLAVSAASPAVDAVPAGAAGCSGADQVDTARPQGTACDIGAYEAVQPVAGATSSIRLGPASCGGATPGSVTVTWGDTTTTAGSASADGQTLLGNHAYLEAGTYSGSVSYGTSDCGRRTTAFDVKVAAPSVPPLVTPAAPAVQSSTAAAFAGSVNPEGAATTAHFEYGLDPKYTGGGSVVYDQQTADQQVGSDFSTHSVTASVSGLVPNALYHARLVATNSAGTTLGPDQTFTTKQDPAPPPPVLGQTVNVTPVDGTVFIKFPNHNAADMQTARAFTKGKGFEPLTEARQIPSGSRIDARRGTLVIAAAPKHSKPHRRVQKVTLTGAIFDTHQTRHGLQKGLTTLTLREGAFPGAPSLGECSTKPAADSLAAHAARSHPRTSHKVLQTLKASDNHGQFGTSTHNSSATVRGTVWDTIDRCDGTLTIVKRGTVDVFDKGKRKTIRVHAGHSYLAKSISRH